MGNGVSDKGSRNDWKKADSLSARARAVNMAKTILEHPLTAAIDPDIQDQIRKEFKIYLKI